MTETKRKLYFFYIILTEASIIAGKDVKTYIEVAYKDNKSIPHERM